MVNWKHGHSTGARCPFILSRRWVECSFLLEVALSPCLLFVVTRENNRKHTRSRHLDVPHESLAMEFDPRKHVIGSKPVFLVVRLVLQLFQEPNSYVLLEKKNNKGGILKRRQVVCFQPKRLTGANQHCIFLACIQLLVRVIITQHLRFSRDCQWHFLRVWSGGQTGRAMNCLVVVQCLGQRTNASKM